MTKLSHMQIIRIIALLLLIFLIAYPLLTTQKDTTVSITSFQECVDAGYPVMESYPRQCNADGNNFVEDIDLIQEEPLQEEESNLVACPDDGKVCPDGSFVGRVGPDCEFAACPEEEAVFCTMDAKECPDGSFVGREWPNCEFAACPAE